MCGVSTTGKKSFRWFEGVVEKDRVDDGVWDWREGVEASRKLKVDEGAEQICNRGATARPSWVACLGEHSFVLTLGTNIECVEY